MRGVKFKERVLKWAQKYKFTRELVQSYSFRTIIFAVVSFVINIGYALFNAVVGIVFLSLWYGALAAYYIMLALMRGGIILYHRKRKQYMERDGKNIALRDTKKYRTCGILLILLPICLSFAILEMVLSQRAFTYPGLMIYTAAVYTFCKIVMAICNSVKTRRVDIMTIKAVRDINFADAMVSVLALQTAMLREFSPGLNVDFVNCLTGGVVCALTVALGVYMVVYGNYKIRNMKSAESENAQIKEENL